MLKIRTVPQQARLLYLVVLQVRMLYLVMQDANLTMPPNRSCQRPQRKSHNAPLPENIKQLTTLNWMMDQAFHHPPANDANLICSENHLRLLWQPTKNGGRSHPWELQRVQQEWLQ